jgi:hypothetical protein
MNYYEILNLGFNRYQAQGIRDIDGIIVVARPKESTYRHDAERWVIALRNMTSKNFLMEARVTKAYSR